LFDRLPARGRPLPRVRGHLPRAADLRRGQAQDPLGQLCRSVRHRPGGLENKAIRRVGLRPTRRIRGSESCSNNKNPFAAGPATLLLAVLVACGPGASPGEAASSAPGVVSADGAGSTASPGAAGADPALPPLVPIKISNPSPAVSILPFYA